MFFCLVVFRCLHFAAALLAFAVPAFDIVVAAPCDRRGRGLEPLRRSMARRLCATAFPVMLLSAFGWYVVTTAQMTGVSPSAIFAGGQAQLIWRATHFGLVCKVRLALWCAAALATAAWVAMPRRWFENRWLAGAAALLNASLLASLAWLGHAGTDGPWTPRVGVDALHLLIAGVWPIGLLPLAWLLLRLQHAAGPGLRNAVSFLIGRYSNLSLGAVLLLAATGIAQIFFLPHPASLIATRYGALLAAKLIAYGTLVALGAINRLLLKPRIAAGDDRALRTLRRMLAAEVSLALVIMAIVAVLGITAPGNGP